MYGVLKFGVAKKSFLHLSLDKTLVVFVKAWGVADLALQNYV